MSRNIPCPKPPFPCSCSRSRSQSQPTSFRTHSKENIKHIPSIPCLRRLRLEIRHRYHKDLIQWTYGLVVRTLPISSNSQHSRLSQDARPPLSPRWLPPQRRHSQQRPHLTRH